MGVEVGVGGVGGVRGAGGEGAGITAAAAAAAAATAALRRGTFRPSFKPLHERSGVVVGMVVRVVAGCLPWFLEPLTSHPWKPPPISTPHTPAAVAIVVVAVVVVVAPKPVAAGVVVVVYPLQPHG